MDTNMTFNIDKRNDCIQHYIYFFQGGLGGYPPEKMWIHFSFRSSSRLSGRFNLECILREISSNESILTDNKEAKLSASLTQGEVTLGRLIKNNDNSRSYLGISTTGYRDSTWWDTVVNMPGTSQFDEVNHHCHTITRRLSSHFPPDQSVPSHHDCHYHRFAPNSPSINLRGIRRAYATPSRKQIRP